MRYDYIVRTAPLDEVHGHTEVRAMLDTHGRDGWLIVGSPMTYTDGEGQPALLIVLRKELPGD
jgi:hypothetical protein